MKEVRREEDAVHRGADHGFLREADAGVAVKELCRNHGFPEASYYTWRNRSQAELSRSAPDLFVGAP